MVWTTLKNPQNNMDNIEKVKRHVTIAKERMLLENKKYITIVNPFYEKGVVPTVSFDIQSDPISEVGVNGCQVSEILEFAKCLIESLNDKFPCRENALAITKIEEAIHWQDARTKNRILRGVEGSNKS